MTSAFRQFQSRRRDSESKNAAYKEKNSPLKGLFFDVSSRCEGYLAK